MSAGHIRARSAGSFELRYRVGGKTATSTWKGDRRSAERELRRLVKLVDDGATAAPSAILCGAWFDRWLGVVKPELSPLTHRLYDSQSRNYLIPLFGAIPLAKLSPGNIQEAWSSLAAGSLSVGSRRLLHRILNASLSRALELELINRNPCHVLRRRLPRAEHVEMTILSPDQSRALIEAARASAMFAPIVLGLGLGARRGEIAALRWNRVDLDRGVVTISQAMRELSARDIRVGGTKSGKTRKVTLPAFAVAELRQWRVEQAEQLLRLGVRQSGETFVCTRADGVRLSPNNITDGFGNLARRLGLDAIHFHSLRHTHASAALAAGASVKVVQERLGHARPSMTLDVYSHVIEGVSDDAAERIDTVFGGR